MISAHLYNVPTLHNALKIQLLCNKIAATLCYSTSSIIRISIIQTLAYPNKQNH